MKHTTALITALWITSLAAAWDKWNSELVDPKWFPLRAAAGKKGGNGRAKTH